MLEFMHLSHNVDVKSGMWFFTVRTLRDKRNSF